jgi:uncharacterized protein (TIGR03435 family)
MRGVTANQLAGMLQRAAPGRAQIVNNTGLSGYFDFDVRWTPEEFLPRGFDRDRFPLIDPDGPSIFTAVQEQLGLKLETTKGQVDLLVIDHVEQPTPD